MPLRSTLFDVGRGLIAGAVAGLLAAGAVGAATVLDEVRALDAQGRTREALTRLEQAAAPGADDPAAALLRGVLLAKLGRTAEARELYQQLILEHPERPEAYNNLAVMHAAAGDYDTAIEILKRGLGTHPSYRTTYDNLTKVYGKLAGEAYSKALGDERIDDQPLRLALINELTSAAAEPDVQIAEERRPEPLAPSEPEPAGEPVEQPAEVAAVTEEPTEEVARAAPAPVPSEPAVAPAAAEAASDQVVWQTVEAWAAAWAEQEIDEYLRFYGEEFETPNGDPRPDWEQLRRQRLRAPEFIRISLALLELERPEPDRAVARFVQSYESDRFSDTVTKSLELVQTDAGWRIVRERVEEAAG